MPLTEIDKAELRDFYKRLNAGLLDDDEKELEPLIMKHAEQSDPEFVGGLRQTSAGARASGMGAPGIAPDPARKRALTTEPLGAWDTFANEAVEGVVPTLTGIGAGAATGAGLGALGMNPLTMLAGGILGGIGGGIAGDKAQGYIQESETFGSGPDAQRKYEELRGASRKENPWSALAGDLAPAAATFRPTNPAADIKTLMGMAKMGAKEAANDPRIVGAAGNLMGGGIQGGMEAYREKAETGKISIPRVLAATAGGSVFSGPMHGMGDGGLMGMGAAKRAKKAARDKIVAKATPENVGGAHDAFEATASYTDDPEMAAIRKERADALAGSKMLVTLGDGSVAEGEFLGLDPGNQGYRVRTSPTVEEVIPYGQAKFKEAEAGPVELAAPTDEAVPVESPVAAPESELIPIPEPLVRTDTSQAEPIRRAMELDDAVREEQLSKRVAPIEIPPSPPKPVEEVAVAPPVVEPVAEVVPPGPQVANDFIDVTRKAPKFKQGPDGQVLKKVPEGWVLASPEESVAFLRTAKKPASKKVEVEPAVPNPVAPKESAEGTVPFVEPARSGVEAAPSASDAAPPVIEEPKLSLSERILPGAKPDASNLGKIVEADTSVHKQARTLGARLGADVQFFKSEAPDGSPINGVVIRRDGKDTIHLNYDVAPGNVKTGGERNPIGATLAHEAVHVITRQHPEVMQEFGEWAAENVNLGAEEAAYTDMHRKVFGEEPAPAKVREEALAGLFEKHAVDTGFWSRLKDSNVPLFRRIANFARQVYYKVRRNTVAGQVLRALDTVEGKVRSGKAGASAADEYGPMFSIKQTLFDRNPGLKDVAEKKGGLMSDEDSAKSMKEKLLAKGAEVGADVKATGGKRAYAEQEFFDAQAPVRAVELAHGIFEDGGRSGYKKTENARNASGVIEGFYKNGQYTVDEHGAPKLIEGSKSYADIMGDAVKAGYRDDVYAYTMGKRALEEHVRGTERNLSIAEAKQFADLGKQKIPGTDVTVAQKAAELQKWRTSVLDFAEKSGLVNPEIRKQWEREFYLPFFRQKADEGGNYTEVYGPQNERGTVNLRDSIQTIKGKDVPLGNLFHNEVQMMSHLIQNGMKNIAANQNVDNFVEFSMAKELPFHEVQSQYGSAPNKMREAGIVTTLRDGKRAYFKIENPKLYEALAEFPNAGGSTPKILKTLRRVFQDIVTLHPKFLLNQIPADFQQSFALGRGKYGLTDYAKEVASAARDIYTRNQDYWRFKTSGGYQGSRYGSSPQDSWARAQSSIEKEHGGSGNVFIDSWDSFKDWYEKLRDVSENMVRLAEHKRALSQGADPVEAGWRGADVMNYQRRGRNPFIKFMADVLPFFGAKQSGLLKIGRSLTGKDKSTTIKMFGKSVPKFLAFGVAYSLAAAGNRLWNWANHPKEMQREEDWSKDYYTTMFINTGEGQAPIRVRVRKPFEFGLFGTFGERMADLAMERADGKLLLDRLLYNMGQTFQVPIDPVDTASNVPILGPMLHQSMNYQPFTQRPIVPESELGSEPFLQYGPNTSRSVRALGEGLSGVLPERFKQAASPRRIEAMTKDLFGAFGSDLIKGADLVARMIQTRSEQGDPAAKAPGEALALDPMRDIPIASGLVSSFVSFPDNSYSADVSKVYEEAKKSEEKALGLSTIRKGAFTNAQAKAYLAENEDAIRSAPRLRNVVSRLGSLQAQIRKIADDPYMTGAEKSKKIKGLNEKKVELAERAREELETKRKKAAEEAKVKSDAARVTP